MSYILDALTKAAQQRDRQAPVVQRLLSPAPRPRSAWSAASGRLLAVLALGAVLLGGALFWWLRPVSVTAPPERVAAPAPAAEIARPLVKLEPLPNTQPKPNTETKMGSPAPPTPSPREAAPAPASPRSGTPTMQPPPSAPPPVGAARPVAPPEASGLKLEALIYADVPAERMVYINGRRYREGDSIDGRLRIEEIREDGVELSDQGRRFSLRVTR